MTDAVAVALIAGIPSTIAAILGVVNRQKIADTHKAATDVQQAVMRVQVEVDGNLKAVRGELAETTDKLLKLRGEASEAIGAKAEKDRQQEGVQ